MTAEASQSGTDALAAGRARLRLKFAAISYDHARYGIDATPELARAGRVGLAQAAWEYYTILCPGRLLWGDVLSVVDAAEVDALALVAIGYDNARHGIDADIGLIRAALEFLCAAAVTCCETIAKRTERRRPATRATELGAG